jgi:hypothetical protein
MPMPPERTTSRRHSKWRPPWLSSTLTGGSISTGSDLGPGLKRHLHRTLRNGLINPHLGAAYRCGHATTLSHLLLQGLEAMLLNAESRGSGVYTRLQCVKAGSRADIQVGIGDNRDRRRVVGHRLRRRASRSGENGESECDLRERHHCGAPLLGRMSIRAWKLWPSLGRRNVRWAADRAKLCEPGLRPRGVENPVRFREADLGGGEDLRLTTETRRSRSRTERCFGRCAPCVRDDGRAGAGASTGAARPSKQPPPTEAIDA